MYPSAETLLFSFWKNAINRELKDYISVDAMCLINQINYLVPLILRVIINIFKEWFKRSKLQVFHHNYSPNLKDSHAAKCLEALVNSLHIWEFTQTRNHSFVRFKIVKQASIRKVIWINTSRECIRETKSKTKEKKTPKILNKTSKSD